MIPERGPYLVEAVRYIDRFKGQLVVIKVGGELIDGGPVISRIIKQVAVLSRLGLRPLVVHGGGVQVDLACQAKGLTFTKRHGRRITSKDVLAVMLEEIGGTLNEAIVSGLQAVEIEAIGHREGITQAVRCTRRGTTIVDGEEVDWGEVGDINSIRADAFPAKEQWVVPVLPSLGFSDDGNWFNVNADAVAAQVAVHLQATKLVILTRVAGVIQDLDAAGPISQLSVDQAKELLNSPAVAGGMRAKLQEAIRALEGGVGRVHIISGREPYTLLREIFTDEGSGTLVHNERELKP